VESNGIKRRKCCIDVGAGTGIKLLSFSERKILTPSNLGLLSLSLHHMGYNILSTDVNIIAEGILATNLQNNQSKDLDAPVLESRTLDWFVDPTKWNWKQKDITTSNDSSAPDSEPTSFLSPPFDFLVTSDSIYHPSLSQPLLRTLHSLSSLQISQNYDASTSTISLNKKKLSSPPIYLALENRDSPLIDAWLKSAQDDWGFKTTRVVHERLEKLIGQGKGGLRWEEDNWHSVEVYKMKWNGITRPEMIS